MASRTIDRNRRANYFYYKRGHRELCPKANTEAEGISELVDDRESHSERKHKRSKTKVATKDEQAEPHIAKRESIREGTSAHTGEEVYSASTRSQGTDEISHLPDGTSKEGMSGDEPTPLLRF